MYMQVSFQLFIRARDEDKPIGSDDDLDDIFINQSIQPNTGYSSVTEYLGNSEKVSVHLRYRIYCQPNYYGTNCATFCMAQNDDMNGHYTCNSADGSIQCQDGYENPMNNCRDSKLLHGITCIHCTWKMLCGSLVILINNNNIMFAIKFVETANCQY